jgi:hypothetical protein
MRHLYDFLVDYFETIADALFRSIERFLQLIPGSDRLRLRRYSSFTDFLLRHNLVSPRYVYNIWKNREPYLGILKEFRVREKFGRRWLIYVWEAWFWNFLFVASIVFSVADLFRRIWFRWFDNTLYFFTLGLPRRIAWFRRFFEPLARKQAKQYTATIREFFAFSAVQAQQEFRDYVDEITPYYVYYVFLQPVHEGRLHLKLYFASLRLSTALFFRTLCGYTLLALRFLAFRLHWLRGKRYNMLLLPPGVAIPRLLLVLPEAYYSFCLLAMELGTTLTNFVYARFRTAYLAFYAFRLYFPINYSETSLGFSATSSLIRSLVRFAIPVFFAFVAYWLYCHLGSAIDFSYPQFYTPTRAGTLRPIKLSFLDQVTVFTFYWLTILTSYWPYFHPIHLVLIFAVLFTAVVMLVARAITYPSFLYPTMASGPELYSRLSRIVGTDNFIPPVDTKSGSSRPAALYSEEDPDRLFKTLSTEFPIQSLNSIISSKFISDERTFTTSSRGYYDYLGLLSMPEDEHLAYDVLQRNFFSRNQRFYIRDEYLFGSEPDLDLKIAEINDTSEYTELFAEAERLDVESQFSEEQLYDQYSDFDPFDDEPALDEIPGYLSPILSDYLVSVNIEEELMAHAYLRGRYVVDLSLITAGDDEGHGKFDDVLPSDYELSEEDTDRFYNGVGDRITPVPYASDVFPLAGSFDPFFETAISQLYDLSIEGLGYGRPYWWQAQSMDFRPSAQGPLGDSSTVPNFDPFENLTLRRSREGIGSIAARLGLHPLGSLWSMDEVEEESFQFSYHSGLPLVNPSGPFGRSIEQFTQPVISHEDCVMLNLYVGTHLPLYSFEGLVKNENEPTVTELLDSSIPPLGSVNFLDFYRDLISHLAELNIRPIERDDPMPSSVGRASSVRSWSSYYFASMLPRSTHYKSLAGSLGLILSVALGAYFNLEVGPSSRYLSFFNLYVFEEDDDGKGYVYFTAHPMTTLGWGMTLLAAAFLIEFVFQLIESKASLDAARRVVADAWPPILNVATRFFRRSRKGPRHLLRRRHVRPYMTPLRATDHSLMLLRGLGGTNKSIPPQLITDDFYQTIFDPALDAPPDDEEPLSDEEPTLADHLSIIPFQQGNFHEDALMRTLINEDPARIRDRLYDHLFHFLLPNRLGYQIFNTYLTPSESYELQELFLVDEFRFHRWVDQLDWLVWTRWRSSYVLSTQGRISPDSSFDAAEDVLAIYYYRFDQKRRYTIRIGDELGWFRYYPNPKREAQVYADFRERKRFFANLISFGKHLKMFWYPRWKRYYYYS